MNGALPPLPKCNNPQRAGPCFQRKTTSEPTLGVPWPNILLCLRLGPNLDGGRQANLMGDRKTVSDTWSGARDDKATARTPLKRAEPLQNTFRQKTGSTTLHGSRDRWQLVGPPWTMPTGACMWTRAGHEPMSVMRHAAPLDSLYRAVHTRTLGGAGRNKYTTP